MLSQTSKISIKAVIYLSAISQEGKKASIDEIATTIDASKHTVGKALQKLAKAGIINSVKGPNGGFCITQEQQNLSLFEIVKTIDGEDIFYQCGLGVAECSEDHPCPIHNEYKEVRTLLNKIFKEKRIRDLHQIVDEGLAFLIH